jgi:hypothetical protein
MRLRIRIHTARDQWSLQQAAQILSALAVLREGLALALAPDRHDTISRDIAVRYGAMGRQMLEAVEDVGHELLTAGSWKELLNHDHDLVLQGSLHHVSPGEDLELVSLTHESPLVVACKETLKVVGTYLKSVLESASDLLTEDGRGQFSEALIEPFASEEPPTSRQELAAGLGVTFAKELQAVQGRVGVTRIEVTEEPEGQQGRAGRGRKERPVPPNAGAATSS